MKDYYSQIIHIENIKHAYLEVVTQFEEQNKMYKYSGADGMTLGRYDLFSLELLQSIQEELIQYNSIDPALKLEVPKRNKNGKRLVFVHSIKERVKSQAVYRIVQPVVDTYFSRFLYSYRSSHPHYKALKTIVRRYKKDLDGYILIGDISNYSDIINPLILKKQIKALNFDNKTEKLIHLYIDMQYLEKGVTTSSPAGIITGLPITVLFNNLYLDAIDKRIGPQVSLYRRIGDDFIMFDHKDNLEKIKLELERELSNVLISKEFQKIKIQKVKEEFDFLGYQFKERLISILPYSIKKIYTHIRGELKYYPSQTLQTKKRILIQKLFLKNSFRHYFIQLVRQYNHANNTKQIKQISEYFFKRVTIYFWGTYSARNRRKTLQVTQDITMPSFMRYYVLYHTGQKTGEDFKHIQ